MKKITLLQLILIIPLMVLAGLTTVLGNDEQKAKNQIAIVDLNSVNQSIGYENLPMLTVDAETKATLKELVEQKRKLQKQLLDADTRAVLEKTQEGIAFVEQKIRSIRATIPRSDSNNAQKTIEKFIREKFKGRYLAILSRTEGYNSTNFLFIPREDISVVNITDQVIRELQEEFN